MKIALFAAALAAASLPVSAIAESQKIVQTLDVVITVTVTPKPVTPKPIATTATTATPVTVSCYRGPWKEVIWDRPNPVFLDSLVAVGYDLQTAQSIGERVCRDPNGVDDKDNLREITRAAMAEVRNRK